MASGRSIRRSGASVGAIDQHACQVAGERADLDDRGDAGGVQARQHQLRRLRQRDAPAVGVVQVRIEVRLLGL